MHLIIKYKIMIKASVLHTSSVLPGVIFPGHHAIAGTLIPPSKVLPFPHLSGPAFPPLTSLTKDGLEVNSIFTYVHSCTYVEYCYTTEY